MKTILCLILSLAVTAGAAVFDRPPGIGGGGTVLVGNLTNSYVFSDDFVVTDGTNVALVAPLTGLANSNGAALTNLNLPVGRTLLVATNFNDATGARLNTARGFASFVHGVSNAFPGDVVRGAPGTYDPTRSILSNLVHLDLAPGTLIRSHNTTGAAGFVGAFTDTNTGPVDIAVTGLGSISFSNALALAAVTAAAIDITNAASRFVGTFDKIEGIANTTTYRVHGIKQNAGTVIVDANLITNNSYTGVYWESGPMAVHSKYIHSSTTVVGASSPVFGIVGFNYPLGSLDDLYVENDEIRAGITIGNQNKSGQGETSRHWIRSKQLIGTDVDDPAVEIVDGYWYLDGIMKASTPNRTTGGDGVLAFGGSGASANVWYGGQKVSSIATIGLRFRAGSTNYVRLQHLEDVGTTGYLISTDSGATGFTFLQPGILTTTNITSALTGLNMAGGTMILDGGVMNFGVNTNAATVGINKTGGTLTLRNTTIQLGANGVNSITGSGDIQVDGFLRVSHPTTGVTLRGGMTIDPNTNTVNGALAVKATNGFNGNLVSLDVGGSNRVTVDVRGNVTNTGSVSAVHGLTLPIHVMPTNTTTYVMDLSATNQAVTLSMSDNLIVGFTNRSDGISRDYTLTLMATNGASFTVTFAEANRWPVGSAPGGALTVTNGTVRHYAIRSMGTSTNLTFISTAPFQ